MFREELAANRGAAELRPKAFSSVGSTEAERLLQALSFSETDGNSIDPIEVPADCSASASPFDYSQYKDEEEGNLACLNHHKAQLEKFGVHFGRGAFQMYDLHKEQRLYNIRTSNGQEYNGNVDGCLAPFGLFASSAASQSRIIYEHKQSSSQKERRQEMESSQVRQGALFF